MTWTCSSTICRCGVDRLPFSKLESFEKTLSTIADADWLTAFALSHTLVVSYQGREIERLSLKGTAAAVAEMLRCQQAMNGNREPVTQTDPFS